MPASVPVTFKVIHQEFQIPYWRFLSQALHIIDIEFGSRHIAVQFPINLFHLRHIQIDIHGALAPVSLFKPRNVNGGRFPFIRPFNIETMVIAIRDARHSHPKLMSGASVPVRYPGAPGKTGHHFFQEHALPIRRGYRRNIFKSRYIASKPFSREENLIILVWRFAHNRITNYPSIILVDIDFISHLISIKIINHIGRHQRVIGTACRVAADHIIYVEIFATRRT